MESSDMILMAVAAIFGMYFLRQMFKSIATVALITVVVCFIYMVGAGKADALVNPSLNEVFQSNNITHMYDLYCSGSQDRQKRDVCACIIQPIYSDLHDRYSDEEIADIESSSQVMNREVRKIIHRNRGSIEDCLNQRNADKYMILERFKRHLEIASN